MKFLNTLAKKITAAVALVAVVAGVTSVAIAGFGPDRPIKDWKVDKSGFSYVTYNSFINIDGKGDERNFLEGVQVGRDATWTDPINNVEAGEIEVKLYMHNNADTSLNAGGAGVARNVKARVAVPAGKAQFKDLTGYISASNANPVEVTDTLTITGANGGTFELEPVMGSGKLIENGAVVGSIDVAQLLGGGVTLPDQNGCSEFVREITFRLKSKVASWTVNKEVSPFNKGEYAKSITAQPGDKVDYLISFQNIGNVALDPVTIGDRLPEGVSYVPGSLQWLSSHTGWKWQNADSTNIFVGGANIFGYDGYTVDSNGNRVYAQAFIRFTAQIAPVTELPCGHTNLVNKAFAKPTGYGTTESEAEIKVNKECETIVVKECVGLNVTKINRTRFDFVATGRVENATIQNYVFTAKDKNGATVDTETVTTSATTANYTFERAVAGDYTVSVVINTDKGVATGVCEQTVKVEEEPATPTYVCRDVKVDILSGRKVRVTVSYDGAPANRVSLKNIEYNFGDGSTPLVTTNNPVEYQYAKDGTYKIAVKVTFAVDGVNQTVSGDACAEVVTFTTEKPKELPNTGAGSIVGLFGAITVAGMFISRWAALRK